MRDIDRKELFCPAARRKKISTLMSDDADAHTASVESTPSASTNADAASSETASTSRNGSTLAEIVAQNPDHDDLELAKLVSANQRRGCNSEPSCWLLASVVAIFNDCSGVFFSSLAAV